MKELEEAIKYLELHSDYNGIVNKGQCIRIPEKNFIQTKKAIETVLQALKNSIPKEVIENKKLLLEGTILNNDYASNKDKDIAEYQVNILQELLNLEE